MSQIRRSLILPLILVVTAGLVACGGTQPIPTPTVPPPALPVQPAPGTWVEFSFPARDSRLPNPVIVEGFAGPGAQIVRIQIKDTNGTLLGEQVVTFNEPSNKIRGFSVQIHYFAPSQPIPGVIEAYVNEAGQPANELSVVLSP